MASTKVYDNSIYKQFFNYNDSAVLTYAANLLDKVYQRGIVPSFIVRNADNNAFGEDDDYISFWTAVSTYCAWLVIYARNIIEITTNVTLGLDFIANRNMAASSASSLTLVNNLISTFYNEVRLRGTQFVFIKASSYPSPTADMLAINRLYGTNSNDGEFLRAIGYYYQDEFMAIITKPTNFGTTVDECSYMYRGTNFDYQLIKGYENTDEYLLPSLYPLINPSKVSQFYDSGLSKNVMLITGDSAVAGFGYSGSGLPTNKIVIDPCVNYEFTFWVSCSDSSANMIANIDYFDDNNNPLTSYHIDGTANTIGSGHTMNISNKYYFVRGFTFGVNEPIRATADSYLDIGGNKHLQTPCGAVYLVPRIQMPSGSSGHSIKIYDFKMRIADTVYTRGFIQVPNAIQVWAKNNNGAYSTNIQTLNYVINPISYKGVLSIPLLEEFTRRYLIPYNSIIIFNWLGNLSVCGTSTYEPSYDDSYDSSHEI